MERNEKVKPKLQKDGRIIRFINGSIIHEVFISAGGSDNLSRGRRSVVRRVDTHPAP